jgi:hypothetical protein
VSLRDLEGPYAVFALSPMAVSPKVLSEHRDV